MFTKFNFKVILDDYNDKTVLLISPKDKNTKGGGKYIIGDGANEELALNKQKISLLENKISLKDSVIVSLESQVGNFDFIILNKTEQLAISQELSKRLEKVKDYSQTKGGFIK